MIFSVLKRITPILLVGMGVICHLANACDNGITTLDTWMTRREQRPKLTIEELIVWNQETDQLQENAAHQVAQAYLKDSNAFVSALQCINDKRLESIFLPAVSRHLFQISLQSLQQTSSPILQRFASAADKNQAQLRLFDAVMRPPITGAPESAGFDRSHGSVYMNLSKVTGGEWPLIFVHEIAHALDDRMSKAISEYNDRDLAKRVAANPESNPDLDRWLKAGLDRGLLAEYRAWVVSLAAYQEARTSHAWASIAWVDELLAQQKPMENLETFIFRYLDERFTDPTEGIFSLPSVQKRLKEMRAEFRRKTPPLEGTLNDIFVEAARSPASQEHRGFKICKQVRDTKLHAKCDQIVNSARYFDVAATKVCDSINNEDVNAVRCLSVVRNKRYPRTNDVWQCWQLRGADQMIECLRRSGEVIR